MVSGALIVKAAIIIVGLVLAVAQQITGINVVFFYAPSIFEQSGIGTNAAFAQAVVVGIVNVLFTLVSMVLIDDGDAIFGVGSSGLR